MKKLIIVDANINKHTEDNEYEYEYDNNNFTYGDIVNLLIKAQKLRYIHPTSTITCRLDSDISIKYPDIHRIISNVYDHVLETNSDDFTNINKQYESTKIYNVGEIGINDNMFDDDYEYYQIKQQLGHILNNHFMFKERDLEIYQRTQHGGFDFRKNKIKFKKESDPKIRIICKLYDIPPKLVHYDQLKYYHTQPQKKSFAFEISPMFDHIEEYDYLTPLIKLTDYHSPDSYYSQLLKRNEKQLQYAIEKRLRLNMIDDIPPNDKDSIMLQYIKCRKNAFAITLWRPAISALNKLIDILEENGEVYYIKTINLTKKGLMNLMFAYYDEFYYGTTHRIVEKKLTYVDSIDDNNPVCFILFDNTTNKHISGMGSPFKEYLRDIIVKLATVDVDDKTRYIGRDMLHINDYFYQTIEYSQIILNENTLEFINKQDTNNYQLIDFNHANLKMQTLRNILYKSMSLLEMDRMITFGGTIFYAYGMRSFNDVDAILIDNLPNESIHLEQFVEHYFSNRNTQFYFLDAGIQGSSMWNDSWTKKDSKIMNFLKIKDYKDLVLNPKNHFYFQGVKMTILEYEMIRKLIRNRTSDRIDFLMLNLLYPQIIEDYIVLQNDTDDFVIADKYKNIASVFDDKFPEEKLSTLKKRYTEDQIKSVKDDNRFKLRTLSKLYTTDQIKSIKDINNFELIFKLRKLENFYTSDQIKSVKNDIRFKQFIGFNTSCIN